MDAAVLHLTCPRCNIWLPDTANFCSLCSYPDQGSGRIPRACLPGLPSPQAQHPSLRWSSRPLVSGLERSQRRFGAPDR